MQVALAVGSAEAELAVGVEVAAAGWSTLPADSMTSRSGLGAGVEVDAVRRAARDDDVVERPERQRAEHGVQRAPAVMDEEDFVGVGVAEQLGLRLGRPAAGQRSRRR